ASKRAGKRRRRGRWGIISGSEGRELYVKTLMDPGGEHSARGEDSPGIAFGLSNIDEVAFPEAVQIESQRHGDGANDKADTACPAQIEAVGDLRQGARRAAIPEPLAVRIRQDALHRVRDDGAETPKGPTRGVPKAGLVTGRDKGASCVDPQGLQD